MVVETAGLEHNRALLERIARWSSDALPGVDVVPVILRQGPPAAAPIEILVFHPDRAELVRAVTRREVHVVQAIALAAAVAVVLFNLAADLGIAALDPRTRRA